MRGGEGEGAGTKDPQVKNTETGKNGSLWDQLEDMNSTECLNKCIANGVPAWHVEGVNSSSSEASAGFNIDNQSLLIGVAVGAIVGYFASKNM